MTPERNGERACALCEYYVTINGQVPRYGKCVRFAPSRGDLHNPDPDCARWPHVRADEWCGEFTPTWRTP